MDTTKNLHNISAGFFFILAFFYVFAALSLRNDFYPNLMIFMMRLMDTPFAFIALLYGGTGLSMQINEGKDESTSAWSIIIFALCLIFFAAVLFVNFAFPSVL